MTNPFLSFTNPTSRPFGSSVSFGETTFNYSAQNNNLAQSNPPLKKELLNQPNSLRRDNSNSAFDNQGNLYTSTTGMQMQKLLNQNPIETELIKSFSSAFKNNFDQIAHSTTTNSYRTFSNNIRKILSEKAKAHPIFQPYFLQYSIFDFFLVNYDNLPYKFRIRDELIYQLNPPDVNNFNLFKSNDNAKSTIIDKQIHKITFLLLLCDFAQAIPIIQSLIENIEGSEINYIQSNYNEYVDFFMHLGRFCEYYCKILQESNGNGSIPNANSTKIQMNIQSSIEETNQELERIIKGIKHNDTNAVFISSLLRILLILKGDINTITQLVPENGLNWYFILLCFVYYKGYQRDFFISLSNTVNQLHFNQEQILEKDLVNIISKSQMNQLEAVKALKAKIPFVLYFAMLSILNDMEISQMSDVIDIYKYEYTEFLNSLYNYDISLEEFVMYFYGYIDTNENSNMIFVHNFAVKTIEGIFNSNNKEMTNDEMVKQIESIKESIRGFQSMKDSLIIINKICFHNYLRLNNYKECIKAYLEYNALTNESLPSSSLVTISNSKCISDPILAERDDMFDLVLSLLMKEDDNDNNASQWERLRDVCIWLSEKKDLSIKVEFFWKYIHFRLRLNTEKDNSNNIINEFFGFCFVKVPYPGCPAMLWLYIINEIKEVIERNNGLSLIKDSVSIAVDNMLLYEDIIKRRMKKYWTNTAYTVESLFEDMTNYLFELKTTTISD